MYDEVGRVFADLVVSGKHQSPDDITRDLGIQFDYAHKLGDPTISPSGRQVGTRLHNYWSYSSTSLTESKDLDEHLRALLPLFVPLFPAIQRLQKENNVFIVGHWESSRLFVGSGPILSPTTCADIGLLGVEFHLQIYCTLEHESSDDGTD